MSALITHTSSEGHKARFPYFIFSKNTLDTYKLYINHPEKLAMEVLLMEKRKQMQGNKKNKHEKNPDVLKKVCK